MPEIITISAEEWDGLNKRLKKMAMEKSYIQLINSLMRKLSTVPGLDNVVENILGIVMDNLGGLNIILYYLIDKNIYCADVYGKKRQLADIDDVLVKKVFETGKPIESKNDIGDTLMLFAEPARESFAAPPFTSHEMDRSELETTLGWTVPLLVGPDVIGVLKMEGMLTGGRGVRDQLETFFNYAALVLKNEIMSYTNLKIVNDRLEREIKVRLEKEKELEESIKSALAANKELEAFSYSISHDLRTPLRAINGYSIILMKDYSESLDDEGKRICSLIGKRTIIMAQLIDDLLVFSRLGRTEMKPVPVDMVTLAQSVFLELTTPEERERIDFSFSPLLPSPLGDPTLLRQVWLNLLGNALKFSSKRERMIIDITGEQRGHELVYSVRDNGVGFDMRYMDKLFGVFNRLHSTREFDGTGVGLAIVQRIVERHGGRVWAKGEVGRGATFYFTLLE